MSLLAVELNDAGLRLARLREDGHGELVGAASPGFALLHGGRVLVGDAAASRYRAAPLHAQNRYWHALGTESLPWTAQGVATAADLAHAHLTAVLAPALEPVVADLLLAVPPGYTREQLGLLVGIANECGVTVRGLVDAGLAACTTVAPAPCMLHLDLQLHQAVATLLEVSRADGALRRIRYELLPGVGVLAFRQSMAAAIATAFVRETRFDPLHQAATEQTLHDRLPDWLRALIEVEATDAEIPLGAATHRIVLPRALLVTAVEALAAEIMRLVQSARPPGTPLHLCFTPRVAEVPGLVARLGGLRDCLPVELPDGAAALGAVRAAAHIARPVDAIALVHRLPLEAAVPSAAAAAPPPETAVPADAVPTHVLFRGRAWAITEVPLVLGWSTGAATRALTLPAGIAGVSRAHCTLRRREARTFVTDHSTYGTFVNDERIGGQLELRAGDVLRLGAPGIALDLIRVLPDHGTP
jgi:FHA domain